MVSTRFSSTAASSCRRYRSLSASWWTSTLDWVFIIAVIDEYMGLSLFNDIMIIDHDYHHDYHQDHCHDQLPKERWRKCRQRLGKEQGKLSACLSSLLTPWSGEPDDQDDIDWEEGHDLVEASSNTSKYKGGVVELPGEKQKPLLGAHSDHLDNAMIMMTMIMKLDGVNEIPTSRRHVRRPRKESTSPPAIKAKLPRILPTWYDNYNLV